MKKGIDISRHQGNINFDEIKRVCDFVIIRIGVGSDLSPDDCECPQCDDKAKEYIDECERLGIPYGIYLYSYGLNDEESVSETEHVREWYNKCNPVLGVWLDMEDADYYKGNRGMDYHDMQNIAVTWLDNLSDIPIKGIYASHSWLDSYMNVAELQEHGAYIWEAHWNDDGEICSDDFVMSQESSDYYIDGVRVDYDIMRDEFFYKLIGAGNDGREWTREQALAVTDGLYKGLLYRGYADGQNEAIVHGLEYDMTRIEAFDSIRDSDEYKKKSLIADCYLCAIGSLPSDEEAEFWFHKSEDDIKQGILYSDKFNNKYGV